MTPMWFLCESHVSPIFRPFLGTDLQRIWNGGRTDLERRQRRYSEGREDNSIKPSENALVQGGDEKIKSFCEGGYTICKKSAFIY